jgi:hypothetical protein
MQFKIDQVVYDQTVGSDSTIPHIITDIRYEPNSDIATVELDYDYEVSAECISDTSTDISIYFN